MKKPDPSSSATPRVRRFVLLGNGRKPAVRKEADLVRSLIEQSGGSVELVDLSGQTPIHQHQGELAIVLGGDGAILRATHQMGPRQVPVLGINMGRLGFLADLTLSEFRDALPQVMEGQYEVTRHVRLACHVSREGVHEDHVALNEALITAGRPFRILDIEVAIDGEAVTTFSGDGLIVSTPIGSTAHNLAAGGPILTQTIDALVVTPICPHTLTWRPLVTTSEVEIRLRCPTATSGTTLVIDGFNQLPLTKEHEVRMRRSPVDFQLARLVGRSYFRNLTEKLHWGNRLT